MTQVIYTWSKVHLTQQDWKGAGVIPAGHYHRNAQRNAIQECQETVTYTFEAHSQQDWYAELTREQFDFLKDLVKDLPDTEPAEKEKPSKKRKKAEVKEEP